MMRIPLLPAHDLAKHRAHQQRLLALGKELQGARTMAYREHVRGLLPQTAKYVVAAWDHHNAGSPPLEPFAAKRDLQAYALRQWGDHLGLSEGPSRTKPGGSKAPDDWHRAVAAVRKGKGDRKTIEAAAAELAKSFTASDARSPFWIESRADERHLAPATRVGLARREAELEAVRRAAPPAPDFANGAQDGGVPGSPHAGTHDVRIHHRGRYDRLGPVVPRRFPEVLAGTKQAPIAKGSGRRELAQWLTSPESPLTSRVMANRLWQWHFGEGIVRTPSNFGWLGERPTHPELLDHLAGELVRSGWSIKRMHRLIMLSATYRQASEAEPETREADPDNRLFGRMNRRRLEAEAVRDSLLAASGRLDRTMKGPASRSFAAPRRTLYQTTIRSDRSGFGPLFDSADNTAPVDKRTVSTVAPQALFLLNNPFALEQARGLALRVMASAGTDAGRVKGAYAILFGRPPEAEELAIGLELLQASRGRRPAAKAWEEYCQVLLCANEFLYVD